jgi:hypothetical protein
MRHCSILLVVLRRFSLPVGIVCFCLAAQAALASTNLSAWVFPGPGGRLLQQPDALGNRIVDASGVGYLGGTVPLPTVPVKVTILPVAGDNRLNIQNAINQVEALTPDANGFRGAVLLTAGEYPLSNTVNITASGVILRGVGSDTNGVILRATATNQYTLVQISGSGSASIVSGTTHNITNNYVPVGARSFNVDSTSGLAVGDHVYVRRIATQQWINDLGMNLLGPPADPASSPWTPSGYNIDMDRVITHIEGNRIIMDNPITCAIDAHYTNGTIRKFIWSGRIQKSGVEHLRGVSNFTNSTDENHGWTFVQFNNIENGWARDVVSQYFGYACVALYSGSKFITVADSQCLDPISQITGGRRYAFVMDDDVLCLVQNCYTREDRHQFVTQSLTTGPNVFVDGLSDNAHAEAGPHHRWATAGIWDNITVNGGDLDAQNAGNFGSGHGWEGANCVIWDSKASNFIVQNPPGARNWLIGSVGTIKNGTVYVGPHDPGTYESAGSSGPDVFPNSLYYSQLQDRMAAPNLQTRDYWLGDMLQFTNNSPTGDVVPVDAAWRTALQSVAGGQSLDAFDVVTNNHWVPFTFNYSLSAAEHVVAATLSMAMRATNSATGDVLYLDTTANSFSFSNLGWLPIAAGATTNTSVRVLDLTGQLGLLADGKLNVAVQGDIGIDWAVLELQVAPNITAFTNTIAPVADALVRAGVNAGLNFGSASTLTVKADTSADNDRKAYLRWDLGGVAGTVYQAKVRLTPVSVGTNAIEQGVALAANNAWSETAVTWNNQPGAGKRFATWIPGTNAPVEFVVTPQVLAALAGDKQMSLQLYSLRNVGSAGGVDYASREDPNPGNRPQLILLVSAAPTNTQPVISDLGNLTIPMNSAAGPISFTVSDVESPATTLTLGGASSNTGLVPNGNIVFGGSGSNRTVTVTPLANQSGSAVITITVTDSGGLSASDNFALSVTNTNVVVAGTIVWNGPGAGNNNWSTSGNWSPAGPPGSLSDVKFFDPGAGGVAVGTVNNFVDFGFNGTITSLQYGNTNGNHTTLISPGQTLDVGSLTVGTETDNGNTQGVYVTITGPGGALSVNNSSSNLVVRQASANSGSALKATLDLSGLDTFTAIVSKLVVGSLGANPRPSGILYLASANTITASGSSPAIQIGGQGGGSGNAGNGSFLYLGRTNVIYANGISVGTVKQGGCAILFNPAFLNNNPAAYFRGASGDLSRVPNWTIADSMSQGGTVNASGTNDFTGGTVDALVDTMTIAKSSAGGSTAIGNPAGLLTFDDGIIDVNILQVGYQGSGSVLTNIAAGTLNVNGAATLIANTSVELGHINAGGTNATRGTININGGSVMANTIFCGLTTNTIAVNGGTLTVTNALGAAGLGLANFSLNNSLLQLAARTGAPVATVTNLTTGGANQINVFSVPSVPSYPAQLTLIKYSGAIAGAGFNFSLGTLPPANPGYSGYLSNNFANASVDLILMTNNPAPPGIGGIAVSGTSLMISGTNGAVGGTYYVLQSTNVALPLSSWTRMATNGFDASGNFAFTNTVNPNAPQQFFRLQLR